MNLNLENKVIIITGGSKGIGFSCAQNFLMEGCRVAIISRSKSNLEEAARKLKTSPNSLIYISCDLIEKESAKAMVAEVESRLGPVDVLVNSAGAAKRYFAEELCIDAWHSAMDSKYFTYIHTIDSVLSVMEKRGRGAIINIIGMGGKVAKTSHLPGGAANSALMLATVGLASLYAPKGIRINAINPGSTMTERLQDAIKKEAKLHGKSEKEFFEIIQEKIPIKRYAAPEEIANLVIFLASEKAGYITGAIVPMDGGSNPVL